ncbi:ABC transporter ATP-binding protein [Kordiimonas sediminis]|uniref:ABC transporter ATP-binding protein n=1 Tax=Kordiimonas sediminis TaxID=1735581 RepID=A0A919E8W1_9PROT|nr:type I secretion system permease/ATPase [Kordiimonas sediminis]GHF25555.1 ABC transporter ATP-binding protein [Kordiimonas sediminis]
MKDLLETKAVTQAIEEQTSPFETVTAACKKSVMLAGFFSMILNILQLTIPLYMMTLLDRVIRSGNKDTLYLLTIIAVVALLTSGVLDVMRAHILNRAASWMESRLGVELFPHVALALHDGEPVKAQGLEDLWRLRSFMSSPGIIAMFDVPWMVFYLIILFMLAVPIGVLALIGVAVLIFLAFYNESSVRNVLGSAQSVAETSRDFVRSVQRSSDEIVAMGMMNNVMGRWFGTNIKALRNQYISSAKAATNLAGFKFFRMFLQICVLFTGAMLVLAGDMSAGTIIGASIIMSRALAPAEQAITAWKQAMSAVSSYKRLQSMLPEHREKEITARCPVIPAALKVDEVSYAFPGTQADFLKGISFEASAGEILGLIGPSASGKSTLAKLLVGAHAPSSGFVTLGDFEMSHFTREEVGSFIGYLPQSSRFLPGSIYENLSRFSDMEIEEVIDAATRIGAHEFIMELPEGYDTQIGGDSGHPLSGGQLQKLAIARAICGKPGLLIMDEPNLNLDNETETLLFQLLEDEKARGATVIVVSHQRSMIEKTDKLVLLVRGRLSQFGTKIQVMRKLYGTSRRQPGARTTGSAGVSQRSTGGAAKLTARAISEGKNFARTMERTSAASVTREKGEAVPSDISVAADHMEQKEKSSAPPPASSDKKEH